MTRDEFDHEALGHLDEVTAFARRLTRNPADSDDLVQATYERAFTQWRSLRDTTACRAWLFRIARNLFVDRWRATRARPELRMVEPGDARAPEPFVSCAQVERLEARDLEWALTQLSEDQAQAVLLCDLWGYDYGEIATITGVPLGTVRSRIARGRDRLARVLAGATSRADVEQER